MGSSSPSGFTLGDGVVYFAANDGVNGAELWSTDGTEAGTALVCDIYPGASSSGVPNSGAPQNLAFWNGKLFFSGVNAAGGEPWASDGTAAGTRLLKDIFSGSLGPNSSPAFWTVLNGQLYFLAVEGGRWGNVSKQIEIWKTDGTPTGTVQVRRLTSLWSGGNNMPFPEMARAGNLLYVGYYNVSRHMIWKSDGTASGSAQLKTWDRWQFFVPKFFELGNLALILGGCDFSQHGPELMCSDGTAAGTTLLKDIAPGSANSNPSGGAVMKSEFYFGAQNAEHGRELWKTDGTEAGTVLVKDIVPGSGSASPGGFTVSGNRLYFMANDGVSGTELWRSDGTEAGTMMVKDIFPGVTGSGVANITALPDGFGVVFSANDGVMGNEVWVSDGSAKNTCRVSDMVPDAGSAVLGRFALATDRLFFGANDSLTGDEPWEIVLADLARDLTIDVKPGSRENPVNRTSRGSIPVAILSTSDFSAADEIAQDSLSFGRTGFEESLLHLAAEDVNGDGLADVVCHFDTQSAGFQPGDRSAVLRGHTIGGAILRGWDTVRVLR